MRKIIHADCDCFFAAVEMRDNPALRDKPIAVGGAADKRGVIATCNYTARNFGIHSAMPTAQALKLCPELVVCPPRMSVYKETAEHIRSIFLQLTDQVEVVSIDEAYLDVSHVEQFNGSATLMARWLKHQVQGQTGVTISVGISVNKFLAKIASDWQKPNGLFIIKPDEVSNFISTLPVEKIHGVGKVTAQKLHQKGIHNCQQLQQVSMHQLTEQFGKFGVALYQRARGEDFREIKTEHIRKSISVERTYAENIAGIERISHALLQLAEPLMQRFPQDLQQQVKSIFIKLRFADFSTTTVEITPSAQQLAQLQQQLKHQRLNAAVFLPLLTEGLSRGKGGIRLLGMGVKLSEPYALTPDVKQWQQLVLF